MLRAGLGRCYPHRSLLDFFFLPLPLCNERMEASYWLRLLVDSFYLPSMVFVFFSFFYFNLGGCMLL